jgi:hypothetical protein
MNPLSKNEEEIKRTLNRQEFEFDEASWDSARELLDREMPVQQQKKKRYLWFWLLVLPALVGATGWWAYTNQQTIFSHTTTQTTDTTSAQKNYTAPDEHANPLRTYAGDTNYAASIIENMEAGVFEDTNQTEYKPVGEPPELMVARMAEREEKRQQKTQQRSQPTQYAATTGNQKEEEKQQLAATTAKQNGEKNTAPIKPTTIKTESSPANENSGPQGQTLTKSSSDNEDNGTENTITDKGKQHNPNLPVPPAPSKTTGDNSIPPAAPALTKEPGNNAEQITVPDSAIAENETTASTETLEQGTKRGNRQTLLKHSISPVLGYGLSRVLYPTANKFGGVPYFGLMYHRFINDDWQASAGIGYTQVNAQGLVKTYTAENYSFGVQRDQTVLTTNKLHYLQIPVQVRFSPVKRYTILGGFTAGYLLNTKNTLSQTTYASLKGYSTMPTNTTTAYRGGINNWDLQWQVGFETHFMDNRLHLGILANGGLTDVTTNSYYNNSVFDRNRRLQLYIRYDVIRF